MTVRISALIQSAIFIATLAYNLVVGYGLPDRVPTHWNIHNQIDGYGSKWTSILLMPGVLLLMLVLTLVLPLISPRQFEIDRFGPTYGRIMVLVSVMMAGLDIVIIQATAGAKFDIGSVSMGVMFIFFAVMGNWMGKVKRNFFMGVRTPWTLADERVWDRTHRQAGHLWFVGGIVGAALSFLGTPIWITLSFLMLMSFFPVVNSFFIYKKLSH